MKKNIIKTIFVLFLLFPLMTSAAFKKGGAGGGAGCNSDQIETIFGCISKDTNSLVNLIKEFFTWTAGIISTLAMLGLIYAGYVYITSAGNPDQITKAKDIIWTSIASLLIIIFSWALFNLLGLT